VTETLAALVLAAGEGRRLRPLTLIRPKPLCPIGDTTLLDLALDRVAAVVPADAIAVNAHHLGDQIERHVAGRVHLSREEPDALGTAGAVGAIRDWLAGRDVLIANGDVHLDPPVDIASFTDGWDRERPRLLVVENIEQPDFDRRWQFAGLSLLPGAAASAIPARPAGLYEVVWRATDLDLVPSQAKYLDCGDPASYLAANLAASGGESVIGDDAVVDGDIERSVIWPGAIVHAGEHLVDTIRARDAAGNDVTVTVS
jgi:GTP:adenosylcobinamide-phosphate guanylyltransferase